MPTKNWFKKDALPFKILTQPTSKNVVKWFDEETEVLDNEELILLLRVRGGINTATVGCVLLGIFMTIVMVIALLFYGWEKFGGKGFFYTLSAPFIAAIVSYLYGFILPTKKIELKRYTGKMTYPSYGFYPHMTLTFTQATVYKSLISGPDATIGGYKLAARNPYNTGVGKGNYDLAPADPEEWWSYFVWYMDKNRPLPPGKAFDPYREKDFERRKAEGFPKPLYKSNILTPEATKEQQKEREKIGGW